LVDEGIGLKSEAKSMDGAMVFVDGSVPDSRVFESYASMSSGSVFERVCVLVLPGKWS
jgi:hypothetical protein